MMTLLNFYNLCFISNCRSAAICINQDTAHYPLTSIFGVSMYVQFVQGKSDPFIRKAKSSKLNAKWKKLKAKS